MAANAKKTKMDLIFVTVQRLTTRQPTTGLLVNSPFQVGAMSFQATTVIFVSTGDVAKRCLELVTSKSFRFDSSMFQDGLYYILTHVRLTLKRHPGCDCPDGWMGEHCEKKSNVPTDVCTEAASFADPSAHFCLNGGTCVSIAERGAS